VSKHATEKDGKDTNCVLIMITLKCYWQRYKLGADCDYISSCSAAGLREVFGRMGFNDQEIVALSGAHAIGR
jgi:Peroxidase